MCNKKYNYVLTKYEAIIITDVDCVVCKYNDNYASSLVAAIYVAVIPNIYNYVCSLVPIHYELLLQYLVRNEIQISAQIKIV